MWTDEKLDVLDSKVDAGFAQAAAEYVRNEQRDRNFGNLGKRFDRLEDKFDALNRTLLQISYGLVCTSIAGVVALIGLVVTLIVTH